MPKLTFIRPDGTRLDATAPEGASVLEVAQEHGIDLEGVCEGEMACSTCHVIVDKDWYDKLPPPGEEENDTLDLAVGLTRTSRLGCQIRLTAALDGLVVRVPATHLNLLNN
jgi:2Fe-2S ferredoxin